MWFGSDSEARSAICLSSRQAQLVEAAQVVRGGPICELILTNRDLCGGADGGPVSQIRGGIDGAALAAAARVRELKSAVAQFHEIGQPDQRRGGRRHVRPGVADAQ